MYPDSATTRIYTITGSQSTTTIESGASTVLGVQIQQENLASNTHLVCNGVDIVRNWARDTPMMLMRYYCPQNLAYSKTGQDTAMLNVTFTTSTLTTSSTGTSSLPIVVNGFTRGEIVISTFLFTLVFLAFYFAYWFPIHRPLKP